VELSEYDNIARLEAQHWWYVGMRSIARGWVRALPLRPGAAILDAGCGTGGGLRWLAEFGRPTGIDLNEPATQYAARETPRVARASVDGLPFASAAFELVTTFEVLYHLSVTDDDAALAECARVLRPGGWLLLRLPAHNWLRGAHDRQVHTRHRYAAGELRQKISAAGLRLRRLTYLGALLWPAAVLKRLTDPSDAAQSDIALPASWINHTLTWLLAAEGVWLRQFDLPLGLSLMALAQKPD
jgi:SAM-dependent methyltransferase